MLGVTLTFETLIRAMWALYAASDNDIERLAADLSIEAESKANRSPLLNDMIKKLEGKAPKHAYDMAIGYKDTSWKALNSYVHGGIHPISRFSSGYPDELISQVQRNVNGVSTMVAMMIAILTGSQDLANNISKIQHQFADCLPDLVQEAHNH